MGKNNIEECRALGYYWEKRFCDHATERGKSFTQMQAGRKGSAIACSKGRIHTLPDISIWTWKSEHHEIKHKNPTPNGMYGLESYRFDALIWFAGETRQDVMYTIHNWELAGGRDEKKSKIEHWFTVNILELIDTMDYTNSKHRSIVNGKWKNNVEQHFWPIGLWQPLSDYWNSLDKEERWPSTIPYIIRCRIVKESMKRDGWHPVKIGENSDYKTLYLDEMCLRLRDGQVNKSGS